MGSPLEQAGALKAPSKYAPIHTSRFFTGMWTQRSELRDAATPYLYEKFYSASRFDSLIDGSNTEINAKLNLVRRPGHSVYNAQVFPAINRFYEFRTFSGSNEVIRVMADTIGNVYDATGPNTKNSIWTKGAGSGSTYFQSVGNVLHFGNGVEQKKWIQSAKSWAALTTFVSGDFFIDTNNNIQLALGARTANITNVEILAGNLARVTMANRVALNLFAGMTIQLAGLTTATFLNGQTVTITSVNYNQITFAFVHAVYAAANDTGTASTAGGPTGAGQPAWATVAGAITADASQQWICKGSSVQNWGIAAPTAAPSVANTTRPAPYPAWAANTIYSPSLIIVDSNGNLQQLTTGGQTGAVAPTWALGLGVTTADNTAVWTNIGPAAWAATHAYALGAIVAVTFTYWVTVPSSRAPRGYNTYALLPLVSAAMMHRHPFYALLTLLIGFGVIGLISDPSGDSSYPVTVSAFFKCTTAGNSGASQPAWADGNGVQVPDNTMVWTNIGAQQTWPGANTLVSVATVIVDSNGNTQTIVTPGKSGAVAPAWATVQGAGTVDGGAFWTNSGPFSAAGTAPWIYSFAGKNSVDNSLSTASPLSAQVTLGAGKLITAQGAGFADPQVDVIQIYRTAQGGSTQLLLDEIPAPAAGQLWTYIDSSTDANLNTFIKAQIAHSNDPPPVGLVALSYHLGRIWGAVGNTLCYSAGPDTLNGNGNQCFPPLNSFVLPSKITRTWPSAIGLIVFTVSDAYIVLGQGTASSTFYNLTFMEGLGLLSYDAFAVNGSTAYMMSSANIVMSIDPGAGKVEIGFPIGDQFLSLYDASTAFVTWHEANSGDTSLYVGDSTQGWFRMAPTSAPESGLIWSPRATVVGGCKAVQSLEVTPGKNKLLVGPGPAPGPILQRDSSVNKDNGSTFAAFATIGSIVMAQPGQLAEMEFIAAKAKKVGSKPSISVLLNEISATVQVPFSALTRTRQQPPLLPPSNTLWSDRYSFSANQSTSFCEHLQIKISWPAEDAHNELLAYTIFGALHQTK